MNTTLSDGVELAKAVSEVESTGSNVIVVICPPFTHIKSIKDAVFGRGISIGAQNIHWENGGAFTGEISANTLKELKCEYVIIGHSERRQYFGENDNTVNKKMLKALETGLIPILCIGESLEERSAGQTFKVLERQLELGLKGVVVKSGVELVIAYEPIWAIGTGQTATTEQAQDAHNFVRSQLIKLLGSNIADTVSILYGGSMNEKNAEELLNCPDVDGGLIGGASLDPVKFNAIIVKALLISNQLKFH